jgi:hypothetical protein
MRCAKGGIGSDGMWRFLNGWVRLIGGSIWYHCVKYSTPQRYRSFYRVSLGGKVGFDRGGSTRWSHHIRSARPVKRWLESTSLGGKAL